MDSPQNHIWGPELWMILHSSAERIGLPQMKRLPQEETRIWTTLLSSLRFSLPCPLCKKHYTTYYTSKPIRAVNRDFIRQWLYELHCQVNNQTDRPNYFNLEGVVEKYSQPFNFTHHYGIVIEQMMRSLRVGWSSREDIQRTQRALLELKRFYDFF